MRSRLLVPCWANGFLSMGVPPCEQRETPKSALEKRHPSTEGSLPWHVIWPAAQRSQSGKCCHDQRNLRGLMYLGSQPQLHRTVDVRTLYTVVTCNIYFFTMVVTLRACSNESLRARLGQHLAKLPKFNARISLTS